MDAYPLGMNPGAKIDYGGKPIGIWFLADGRHQVQFPEERVEFSLQFRQLSGNPGRVRAVTDTGAHLDFFEARLAAERADKARIGHGRVFHRQRLPALRRGQGWEFPPLRGANNRIETLAEVPAKLGPALVPVRRLRCLGV